MVFSQVSVQLREVVHGRAVSGDSEMSPGGKQPHVGTTSMGSPLLCLGLAALAQVPFSLSHAFKQGCACVHLIYTPNIQASFSWWQNLDFENMTP